MNTVYVLGAGSSAAVAGSSRGVMDGDFLRRAFEMAERDESPSGTSSNRLNEVKRFVYDLFYLGDSTMAVLPLVEEVLSLIDIALERGESLSDKYTSNKLEQLRHDFAFLIYIVLEDAYQSLPNWPIITDFAAALGDASTVISFNYDVILDHALRLRYGYGDDMGLDYGFEYQWYRPGTSSPQFVKPGNAHLLKIHGSLNWALCPTCGVVYVCPKGERISVRNTFHPEKPARCVAAGHAALASVLIAPTFLKSYARPHLSMIWHKTECALRSADQVVFIGYSLPDADYEIKYLLQESLYRSPQPGITVVDYKPDYQPAAPTPEELCYRRLFGSGLTYYPHGFAQYVDEVMRAGRS